MKLIDNPDVGQKYFLYDYHPSLLVLTDVASCQAKLSYVNLDT